MRQVPRILFAVLAGSLLQVSAGAVFAASKNTDADLFQIELRTEPEHPAVGNNAAVLTLSDAKSNTRIDDAAIEVIPWMTLHGHGSPKKPTVRKQGNGQYRVENLYLTMEGDWDLIVTVRTKAGKDTATLTIPVVQNK